MVKAGGGEAHSHPLLHVQDQPEFVKEEKEWKRKDGNKQTRVLGIQCSRRTPTCLEEAKALSGGIERQGNEERSGDSTMKWLCH